MSDICLSPSLSSSHGFFDTPDTHSLSYDLVPIFSQSKTSSNSDILYPSPWYWVDMVQYDAARDVPWAEKQDKLYWRGSTTGGFGSGGNWKKHHRQRFVDTMNGNSSAFVLSRRHETKRGWEVETVRRGDYRELVDMSFTRVVQCEQSDCDSQAAYFDVQRPVSQQDGWSSKFLLDMDGNAFSGRFYALLRSTSLTFKFAVFREWHNEWVKPWVHYIPLSLQGKEWLEVVRYFSDGKIADTQANEIAAQSSDWANMSLRREDMETWFFRLLLE
ncbi:glycosyltransferase family 90 protein [Beauveria brongniartii RCEF 3172]|uniref:Glycosyltransferase family 90 protein n=1 Tax=Beauveria brongniartii RCEF 3172 TaxID=1081107 RepID=A0A162JNG1_9HYPO|nr:glycosyltransferase family 90 protein [Beauveria brongniartii RCEF 3172]